jgi:hypothetical protein
MLYRISSIMFLGLILVAFSVHAKSNSKYKNRANSNIYDNNDPNSNINKFITGNVLDSTDTDNDQLTDFFEVHLTLTNPALPDTDSNGINDSDEDFDNDGLNNLQEQILGMNPHHAAIKDDVYNFYILEKTFREDAESGNKNKWINKWTIKEKNKERKIQNIVDPENPNNRVIEIKYGLGTLCKLKFNNPEFSQFKIQWDMAMHSPYIIIVSCMTTEGQKYLCYTGFGKDRNNRSSNNRYIQRLRRIMNNWDLTTRENRHNNNKYTHCPLGTYKKANERITVRRDLQQDIWDNYPDCNIIYVDSFMISGRGYIDNIITLAYADADHDFIPDSVEDAAGMDKSDPSDTIGDIDGDGISNLDEFYAGTLELSSITDEDNDQIDDDWEKKYFANLDQNANGDFDKDGLTNLEEMNVGTDPTKKDTDGDDWTDKQEVDAGMNPTDPDEDNDKLPDGWEMKYFGNMNQTAEGDPDNDKVNNITEYKYGRHPNAGSRRDTENKMRLNISLPLR